MTSDKSSPFVKAESKLESLTEQPSIRLVLTLPLECSISEASWLLEILDSHAVRSLEKICLTKFSEHTLNATLTSLDASGNTYESNISFTLSQPVSLHPILL